MEDTLNHITPLCRCLGLTRISDITLLDKLYIPNFSAVLPGTEDIIWVYGGKGPTKLQAKASALMEAIERHSSLPSTHHRNFIQGKYSQLSKSYKVLHHAEVVESVSEGGGNDNYVTNYVSGIELFTNQEILVPAELALYRYTPPNHIPSIFSRSHTNGLASGNVIEEAICHALCEVIERDAVSIADLCASSIPYNILEGVTHSLIDWDYEYPVSRIPAEDKFVDDPSIFYDLNTSEISDQHEPASHLVKRFTNAGIPLLVKDITQKDIGIPTFVASSIEWINQNYGYFAKGYGAHPNAGVALVRAITEVSQTRCANIQGSRDDLKKIRYKENDEIYKRKWQFMPDPLGIVNVRNKRDAPGFSNIITRTNSDILDDIHIILAGLKKAGLNRAIIVDLTNPNIGVPVVRAIVPGLETFEVNSTIMGTRAKNFFTYYLDSSK